jgi:hypothetical protein
MIKSASIALIILQIHWKSNHRSFLSKIGTLSFMLNLRSLYMPFVLQQMEVTPPPSTANNFLASKRRYNQNSSADTFVKFRSGGKYPGFETNVKKALAVLERSFSSESAQQLKTHTEAWIVALEQTLERVGSDDERISVRRSLITARQHLETALLYIED